MSLHTENATQDTFTGKTDLAVTALRQLLDGNVKLFNPLPTAKSHLY